MIYGNQYVQDIFNKFTKNIKDKLTYSGFFIVCGPKNIGKKTLIKQLIDQIGVLQQDLLFIEDPQEQDGKNYQIRIEIDEKDRFLEINGKKYTNFGAREIVDFVSKTPMGDYKFVFIENIERMNKSTANAMLKTLEEPPLNTFIFVTCSNKQKLLDTIISRGTLINMNELNKKDFEIFLQDNYDDLDEIKSQLIYAVSGGRVGLAKQLFDENSQVLEKIEQFIKIEDFEEGIFCKFTIIKDLINIGKIDVFIDGLIFYYININDFEKTQKLIDIKNKSLVNVNIENLLFNYISN